MRKFLETQMSIPVKEIDSKIYNTLLDNVFKAEPDLFIRNLVLKNSSAVSQESISKLVKIAESGDVSPEKLQRIFANTADQSVDDVIESINKLVTEKPTGWQKQLDELAGTEKVIKETAEVVTETMKTYIEKILKNRHKLRTNIIRHADSKTIATEYYIKVKNTLNPPYDTNFEKWYDEIFMNSLKKNPTPFEAHHILPYEALEDLPELQKILDWARKNGKNFDFNGIDNGIMVQKKSLNMDIAGHGNHPQYTDFVKKRISEIFSSNKGNMAESFEDLKLFSGELKNLIFEKIVKGNSNINDLIF